MSCQTCQYPELDCPCCCKEKAIYEGLIRRLNGYECYLRNFTVPASCAGLPNSSPVSGIISGGNPNYFLNKYVMGTLAAGQGSLRIRMWPAIGCGCAVSGISNTLYKFDSDCWGPTPLGVGANYVSMNKYLKDKYSDSTHATNDFAMTVVGILSKPYDAVQLGTLKATTDWIQEAKKYYNSIVQAMPC